jgi:hypothetical protein
MLGLVKGKGVRSTVPATRMTLLFLGTTLALWMVPGAVRGEPSIVVVPAGDGPGLEPTALIADALVTKLNEGAKHEARLAYPAPILSQANPAVEKKAALLLKKAHVAYEQMKYDTVETLLRQALQQYKTLLKGNASVEGYLQCLHLLAATALLEGKEEQAFSVMNDAFIFLPTPPSKKLFNPTVIELYEKIAHKSPGEGTLVLDTSPPAFVWLNGVFKGLGQGRFALRAGAYLMRLYRPGYSLSQRWVQLKPDKELSLSSTLSKGDFLEEDALDKLREEGQRDAPGSAVESFRAERNASQVLLVLADKGCHAERCQIGLRWSREGKWLRTSRARYSGEKEMTVAQLLEQGLKPFISMARQPTSAPVPLADGQDCTIDEQCASDFRCLNGHCGRKKSVMRSWWFWSLIGAAATGVTLAIVLPLSRPEPTIIEVR